MGVLKYYMIHCSDTPVHMEVTPEMIKAWHMNPVEKGGRGWSRVGYSDMIALNGAIYNLVPYNEDEIVENDEMTWGCAGLNSVSRHICIIGGRENNKPADTVSELQKMSLEYKCKRMIALHPDIIIGGHYQFTKGKSCPNFDVPKFLKSINIPLKNIKK